MSRLIEKYLRRHGQDHELPAIDLKKTTGLVVVIPAMGELASLPDVLGSLAQVEGSDFEVIVVINHPDTASQEIKEENRALADILAGWQAAIPLHVVGPRQYPNDRAGVGRARREGLDQALRAFYRAGRPGLLACLDADSPVDPDYVSAVTSVFEDPGIMAGVCRFEHPFDTEEMRAYEIWLLYRLLGLRFAGSPYAYQPLGSCIVMRTEAYAASHGMPMRKAGEDFYMVQKLLKTCGFDAVTTITNTVVRPSARISDRVPFGTGPSLQQLYEGQGERYRIVVPASAFEELRAWNALVVHGDPLARLPATLGDFMQQEGLGEKLEKIRSNHIDESGFQRGVHTLVDGLVLVRFLHFYRQTNGALPIAQEAEKLLDTSVKGPLLDALRRAVWVDAI